MRWIIVDPGYQPHGGGGNWAYIREFAKALVRNCVETHLLTVTDKLAEQGVVDVNGVFLHKIYAKEVESGPMRSINKPVVTGYVLDMLADGRGGILNPQVAFSLVYNRIPRDVRIVHTLHAVISYEYSYDCWKALSSGWLNRKNIAELIKYPIKIVRCVALEKRALARADKIIVMSQYVKGIIKNVFPDIDEQKIMVSRIGVDEKFFPVSREEKSTLRKTRNLADSATVFFTVRRLTYRMGLMNLLEAFRMFVEKYPDQDVRLLIAGKGILADRLQSFIDKHHLSGKASLLGFVSDEDLVSYYQQADVFVLPTEELEGFGIVSLEALACNLPEIATPAGANPEIVSHFHPELLAEGVDAKAIFLKMAYYWENRERYKTLNNVQKVKDFYCWDSIIEEILKELRNF